MAKKDLKLNIKNTQIAKAIDLDKLKGKLAAKKKKPTSEKKKTTKSPAAKAKKPKKTPEEEPVKEEPPRRVKARSTSVFTKAKILPSAAEADLEPTEITAAEQKEIPPKVPAAEKTPTLEEQVSEEEIPLGPTGKHIKDLLAPPPPEEKPSEVKEKEKGKLKAKGKDVEKVTKLEEEAGGRKKGGKASKFKEFRDIKPARRHETPRSFDARDRQGLRTQEEEGVAWRKKRVLRQPKTQQEDLTIRPTELTVRLPITLKDLAAEMKLKASQLISKLFLQGVVVTLNDLLDDETTIQLLGHDFGCEITIDTSEEKRIQITDKTIKEEIAATTPESLKTCAPVVAFMGHVDHGKTSLIDGIRKTNQVSTEAGAITQHIGAFRCHTKVGDITILDTPGHEAFSAMRARGADVTDIVVLVIAGDEGIRQQTLEAIQHAKAAGVSIVAALNKCDKPNFDAENVYRQLAENELLPEAWGGQTITVNCSAVTGEGVDPLLEMLALQAEVLELKANPKTRARGTVLESELHKGLGAVTTVLIQNGTLHLGDALVFSEFWGHVKTMHDENGRNLQEAGPSTPVEITGLSGLPEAGEEFIVVANEREAREIAEARQLGMRQTILQQKKRLSMENLLQQVSETGKKVLNIVLRADVQGSLEAIKIALQKIESEKAEANIIFTGVGEVSESDIQLAAASKAVVIGFHTQIETHAEAMAKQLGVQVRLHDVIYHAIEEAKQLMAGLLDKLEIETDKGKVEVKALFKSSQVGVIAGCQVTEGTIHRNHHIRVRRGDDIIWTGTIASLKRVKEDVREVQKGLECGIVLTNFTDIQEGDILEAYEVTYEEQQL